MKIKATEEFTPRGKDTHVVQHEPCWAFVKRLPRTAREAGSVGGWRVAARLRDKTTPAGEGTEAGKQVPSDSQLKALKEGWSMQKATIKADNRTITGRFANFILR